MARKKSKANYFTKETEDYIVKYNNSGLTNGVTTTAAGLYTWRTDTGSTVDPTFVHSFIVGDLA